MTKHGWKHDDLAADLAQHLLSDKRMVWTDMQLGPSGSPRPDVYTLERAYSRPLPTAYECKISRSDLRSDTTSGKWQKYLDYAGAVIFAVPEGLCTPADIPAGCGLMVRKAQTWRHVRKATRIPVALPMDACMKMLIDGVNRSIERSKAEPRRWESWHEHAAIRKKFGEAVALAARDIVEAQTQATDYKAQRERAWADLDREVARKREFMIAEAKKDAAHYEAAKRDLIEWLDLSESSSVYAVSRRLAELRADCDADMRVQKVEAALQRALSSARSATLTLEAITQDKDV